MIQLRVAVLVALATSPARADAPVSLPWSLRSPAASSVVRLDTAVGTFVDSGTRGETGASVLTVSDRITSTLAPLARVAFVDNRPATGPRAVAISNPIVGLTWAPIAAPSPWRLATLVAVAVPAGSGGGDDGNPARAAAEKAAVFARSAMDNSLFAVNYVTPIVGLDLGYVRAGWTVQAEATLFQSARVRGAKVDPDAYKTNSTSGVHVGYFLAPWLCASTELRYQRYLSTPKSVAMTPATRDNLTVAFGLRTQIVIAPHRVLKPGLSYARGLDDPMAARSYQIVQLDLPFAF
jgi:hypothetical protein